MEKSEYFVLLIYMYFFVLFFEDGSVTYEEMKPRKTEGTS